MKHKFMAILWCYLLAQRLFGQPVSDSIYYRQDRGAGITTSLFGTYIEKGDFIVYPFYEHYIENKNEYNPKLLGFNQDKSYTEKFSAHEELIYFGYGITEWLMVEMEASIIQAKQRKSSLDNSNMPAVYRENGIENIEGQFRWHYWKEKQHRPELFSYLLAVLPTQGSHRLIGTQGYEFKFGTGLIKGFRFGTISTHLAIQYNTEDKNYEFGGITIEYLKRINKTFRVYAGLEGIPDATELITEIQIFPQPWMFIRLNNAFGISPEATDIAPEIGVVFYVNKIKS